MKLIYISLGFISISIGAVGAFVPLLPTTPLLLLGSFFLAKGSDRFSMWFRSTKLYKNNLESFEKRRSMTLRTKLMLSALSSSMIWLSIFTVDKLWLRVMLVAIDLFKHYYFIYRIKTDKGEDHNE